MCQDTKCVMLRSLMADSHPVQMGTAPCTSPHHVLPLLPFPLWVLTELCSAKPAFLFAHTSCHHALSSLSFLATSFLPASISIPHNFRFLLWVLTPSLPHIWTWGLYFWYTSGYTAFFFRYQLIIGCKYRTRARDSTKHTSSGCFPAYKNTNFQ